MVLMRVIVVDIPAAHTVVAVSCSLHRHGRFQSPTRSGFYAGDLPTTSEYTGPCSGRLCALISHSMQLLVPLRSRLVEVSDELSMVGGRVEGDGADESRANPEQRSPGRI